MMTYLPPIVGHHPWSQNRYLLNLQSRNILRFRTLHLAVLLLPVICGSGPTLAQIIHTLHEIHQRPLARVLGPGPSVEREWAILVAPPRAERAKRHAEIIGR